MTESLTGVYVTREQIIEQARTWMGVPWRHQGRNRSGIDCGGLVIQVAIELGLGTKAHDKEGYERLPTLYMLVTHCAKWMRQKLGEEYNDRLPGDVVVMKPNASYPWPAHLGILSRLPNGELGMIHSYSGTMGIGGRIKGGVLESSYAPWWEQTVGVFEYPGLKESEK
jgi:hypothetical protein